VSLVIAQLIRKRLELLTEIVPRVLRVAVFRGQDSEHEWQETQAAARSLKRDVLSLEIKTPREIEHAFRAVTEWRLGRPRAAKVGEDGLDGEGVLDGSGDQR